MNDQEIENPIPEGVAYSYPIASREAWHKEATMLACTGYWLANGQKLKLRPKYAYPKKRYASLEAVNKDIAPLFYTTGHIDGLKYYFLHFPLSFCLPIGELMAKENKTDEESEQLDALAKRLNPIGFNIMPLSIPTPITQ